MNSKVAAWLVIVCLAGVAQGQVIIDDHFDDANVETNTWGVGAGFVTRMSGSATITESGTVVKIDLPLGTWGQIVSQDTFSPFIPSGTMSVWKISDTTGGMGETGNRRTWFSLRIGTTAADALFIVYPPGSPTTQGLWFSTINNRNTHPPAAAGHQGNLIWVDSAGTVTQLATWEWAADGFDGENAITAMLYVTDTAYSLSFDQPIESPVGLLAGQLPSAPPATVRIGIFDQVIDDGAGSTTVDQILVASYPGAWNPSPASGATGVSVDGSFSWSTGVDPNNTSAVWSEITGHLVYLGIDPNNLELQTPTPLPVATTVFDPTVLNKDTTYYWRVDEEIGPNPLTAPNDRIVGPVWSFGAEASIPEIVTQPADRNVIVGSRVVFTVEAMNPLTGDATGLSYQWFDPNNIALPGETGASLVFDPVAAEDQWSYYCRVSNANRFTDSELVGLGVAQVLVHWEFDAASGTTTSEAADSSGNNIVGVIGSGTALTADAGRTDTAGDDALSLSSGSEAAVAAMNITNPDVTGLFDAGASWTINQWVKLRGDPFKVWLGGGFGLGDSGASGSERYLLGDTETHIYFYADTLGIVTNQTISLNEWHMLTVTYDGDSNATRVYKDGELIGSKTLALVASAPHVQICPNADLGLGYTRYTGLIDDFVIYDNVVDQQNLIEAHWGAPVCQAGTEPESDFNGNCLVNLGDLAIFINEWLVDTRMLP